MMKIVVERLKIILVEKIKRTRGRYEEVVKVVEEMKKAEVRTLKEDKWKIEEELVLKKRKVHVLKNKELRLEVIQLHHNVPVAGHRDK